MQTKLPTRIIAKSKDSSPVIARDEVPKQSQKSIKIIPPLTKQPLIIPPLEKGGKGGFEDLRRELLSRKYSYKTVKAWGKFLIHWTV
ncbi:MAG: hypothetical protein FJ241_11170 [Nitrospira sp.]|nr:hypothetical protein [Nitrospira sp.]